MLIQVLPASIRAATAVLLAMVLFEVRPVGIHVTGIGTAPILLGVLFEGCVSVASPCSYSI